MRSIYIVTLSSGKVLRIFSSEENIEEEAKRYVETHNKYYQVHHTIVSITDKEESIVRNLKQ